MNPDEHGIADRHGTVRDIGAMNPDLDEEQRELLNEILYFA